MFGKMYPRIQIGCACWDNKYQLWTVFEDSKFWKTELEESFKSVRGIFWNYLVWLFAILQKAWGYTV
jgi:hypothetical protein